MNSCNETGDGFTETKSPPLIGRLICRWVSKYGKLNSHHNIKKNFSELKNFSIKIIHIFFRHCGLPRVENPILSNRDHLLILKKRWYNHFLEKVTRMFFFFFSCSIRMFGCEMIQFYIASMVRLTFGKIF